MEKVKREFETECSDVDSSLDLSIIQLFNNFQKVIFAQVKKLNLGLDWCTKNNVSWVASDYQIRIKELPKLDDKYFINSWTSVRARLYIIQEFELVNSDGEKIVEASSRWVLMDSISKRPTDINKYVGEDIIPITSERLIDGNFPKLNDTKEFKNTKYYEARGTDIDFNRHVNNAIYPMWAKEALPKNINVGKIKKIEVKFIGESFAGEKICVFTDFKDGVSYHSIRVIENNEREVARVRIQWAVKD